MSLYDNYLYTTSTTNTIQSYPFSNNVTVYLNHEMEKSKPEAFFTPEMVAEAMPRPESDLDWLERRVEEICWEPA